MQEEQIDLCILDPFANLFGARLESVGAIHVPRSVRGRRMQFRLAATSAIDADTAENDAALPGY